MARDDVAFLAGSPDRLALLDVLAEGAAAPRDVAAALDVSTRSAQRNLSQLVERGWAERREGEYHLTTVGHLVRSAYAACLDRFEAIEALDAFYEHFPHPGERTAPGTRPGGGPADDDSPDVHAVPDPAWLVEATCVTADPDHPQAPVEHYVQAVDSLSADHVRMVAPVLSRLFHEPHAQQVIRGASTELVLPAERVAAARRKNPLEFETVLAVPRFSLYRTDEPVEFGLTVADERTFLLAYDDEGQVRACVDGTHGALREWAVDRFETFCDGGTEVEGRGPF